MINPFLLIMIARNVRDIYILLFIVILLLAYNIIPSIKRYSYGVRCFAIVMMITLRPICLLPLFLIYLIKFARKRKVLGTLALFLLLVVTYIYKDFVLQKVLGQFMSAASEVGEEFEEYLALYEGQISSSSLIPFFSRLVKISNAF